MPPPRCRGSGRRAKRPAAACTGRTGWPSNSLLEGLVYGALAGEGASAAALDEPDTYRAIPLQHPATEPQGEPINLADVHNSLQSLMWRAAGVRRNGSRLEEASEVIDRWCRYALREQFQSPEGWELQNMLLVSRVMIAAALRREESRGVHLRSDFPETDDQHWARRIASPAAVP